MVTQYKNLIDGEMVETGEWMDVVNPANEEVCAVISLGSEADVDKAVAAAKAAFETYSQTSREERLALFEKLMEVMKKRHGDMADAISTEMGAPASLAQSAQAGCGPFHLQGFVEALKTIPMDEEY